MEGNAYFKVRKCKENGRKTEGNAYFKVRKCKENERKCLL